MTRRWRIVHSESETGWGGQEHRIMAEMTGFQRRGCEVLLLAPTHSEIFRRAAQAGIPTDHLPVGKLGMPLSIVRMASRLRRFRPDVLNLHSSRDGWICGIAGRLARVPFIVRTRHIDVSYPNSALSRHAYTTLCDHVLTTSEKISSHFVDFFQLPRERVTTLATGIDLDRFHPGVAAASFPFPKEAGVPWIGMISVLRSWKGHMVWIDAMRQLKSRGFRARCIVTGSGPGLEHYQEYAGRRGVADMFYFAGHREDVPNILRSLDLLLIPSTDHEGVPQIGLQALAMGTPVVGSDVGGIPEIIRPAKTGRIFPNKDWQALARSIETVFSEPEETGRMAGEGQAWARKNQGLQTMLDRLETLYDSGHAAKSP